MTGWRSLPLVLVPVLSSAHCAAIDGFVFDESPPPGSCRTLPVPFAAAYEDGKPFLRVEKIDRQTPAIRWTYFDKSGAPILVQHLVDRSAMSFTAYYPNGAKRMIGHYRFEGEPRRSVPD